jgi:hypothetical protein
MKPSSHYPEKEEPVEVQVLPYMGQKLNKYEKANKARKSPRAVGTGTYTKHARISPEGYER